MQISARFLLHPKLIRILYWLGNSSCQSRLDCGKLRNGALNIDVFIY